MKIYIATSWKNAFACRTLAELLRAKGHEVYDFTDPKSNAHVFNMAEFLKRETLAWHDKKPEDITQAMLEDMPHAVKAYESDIAAVKWSDCVVMLLPCGNSAHMEAGYAKGAGKLLYITGTQKPGDYDVMRLMADGKGGLEDLLEFLKEHNGPEKRIVSNGAQAVMLVDYFSNGKVELPAGTAVNIQKGEDINSEMVSVYFPYKRESDGKEFELSRVVKTKHLKIV